MRERCRNPRGPLAPWYHDKGITICPAWDDFLIFYADVGARPAGQWYLDRINPDGNYEPGNVRWATVRESMLNRSFVKNAAGLPTGVRQVRGRRFQARAKYRGVEHHLGTFDTAEDAGAAVERWRAAHAD